MNFTCNDYVVPRPFNELHKDSAALVKQIRELFKNIKIPLRDDYSDTITYGRIEQIQLVLNVLAEIFTWDKQNHTAFGLSLLQFFVKAVVLRDLLDVSSQNVALTYSLSGDTNRLQNCSPFVFRAHSTPHDNVRDWYQFSNHYAASTPIKVIDIPEAGITGLNNTTQLLGFRIFPYPGLKDTDLLMTYLENHRELYDGLIFPIPVTSPQIHSLGPGK